MEYRKRHAPMIVDILEVGRRMHRQGLVASTGGNISVRIGEDRFLITASGVSKGSMREEHILVIDGEGKVMEGKGRPSNEFRMHVGIYRERPDTVAVVQAHPPTATAFTVAGVSLMDPVLPEIVLSLGGIPTVSFGVPGSEDLMGKLRPYLKEHDAVLLENHGAVTLGGTLMQAWNHMEAVEMTAKIRHTARMLGTERRLTREELDRLLLLRSEYTPQARTPSGKIIHTELRARARGESEEHEDEQIPFFE
ncbi:class II aldolase/adducin family protein [Salinithrix halophila]|uniref:Class II aldolase/adducin family protein n=1 Tax=Salinithrix halophila TaxID=1485204 RepID=A0ABV8JFS4_9BACL